MKRWRPWIDPIVLWLASSAIFYWAARAAGLDYFATQTHSRWDSFNYVTIAAFGYEIHPCTTVELSFLRGAQPGSECGNIGWFPLYPALLRGTTMLTGANIVFAGWMIAELASIALLVALSATLRRMIPPDREAAPPDREAAVVAVAAMLPAGIYFHAVFPMSLAAWLLVIGTMMVARRSWLRSGLAFGLAAMCHSTAVVAAVIPGGAIGWLMYKRDLSVVRSLPAAAASVGATVFAFALVLVIFQFSVGRWDAFFQF